MSAKTMKYFFSILSFCLVFFICLMIAFGGWLGLLESPPDDPHYKHFMIAYSLISICFVFIMHIFGQWKYWSQDRKVKEVFWFLFSPATYFLVVLGLMIILAIIGNVVSRIWP